MKLFTYRVQEKPTASPRSDSHYSLYYPQWKFILWPQWFYFNREGKTVSFDRYWIVSYITRSGAQSHITEYLNCKYILSK